jgi:hypothetical protein
VTGPAGLDLESEGTPVPNTATEAAADIRARLADA